MNPRDLLDYAVNELDEMIEEMREEIKRLAHEAHEVRSELHEANVVVTIYEETLKEVACHTDVSVRRLATDSLNDANELRLSKL